MTRLTRSSRTSVARVATAFALAECGAMGAATKASASRDGVERVVVCTPL